MRSVYVLRHAKSDWSAGVSSDHERPLNRRGAKSARRMGAFLTAVDQIPDRIVSSTATRARTTVELAADAGGWDRSIELEGELYGAESQTILGLIQSCDDSCDRLLLVGHEPSCSSTISELTGGGRVRFPTAALGRVDFAAERWTDIQFGAGSLIWLVIPRLLKRLDQNK